MLCLLLVRLTSFPAAVAAPGADGGLNQTHRQRARPVPLRQGLDGGRPLAGRAAIFDELFALKEVAPVRYNSLLVLCPSLSPRLASGAP